MPRRNKGKGKGEAAPAPPRDQPHVLSDNAGPSSPLHSPTTAVIKPALTTGEIHMDRVGLLHPIVPTGQVEGTSIVSTTVINIRPASSRRARAASANTFEALNTLVEHPVEDWAEEATAASNVPIQATELGTKEISVRTRPAEVVASTVPQLVRLAPSEIQRLRKTKKVLLVGERGQFTWYVAQGLLSYIATKYQEEPSLPFPSGLTLDFPQTPGSVLKYVQQFIRNGGFDALHSGAVLYPGSDVRALIHLQNVAGELGILELETRASRDIALVQHFLHRHSSWAFANQRRTAAMANPELFIIMAEQDNKLYKVHCRKREMEKRGTQTTRGTLRCVGVIRHFVEYLFPQGPFDIIGRDHDGFWTVTCSAAMLKVDFVLKRDQQVDGHLDLVQLVH